MPEAARTVSYTLFIVNNTPITHGKADLFPFLRDKAWDCHPLRWEGRFRKCGYLGNQRTHFLFLLS